jgi:hypothetical protein
MPGQIFREHKKAGKTAEGIAESKGRIERGRARELLLGGAGRVRQGDSPETRTARRRFMEGIIAYTQCPPNARRVPEYTVLKS